MNDWPRSGIEGLRGMRSPRKVAVLCLVANGLSNMEIAERLNVGRHTVVQRVADMLGQLQARDRAELVARACAVGMLSASSWRPICNR
jgi:DNA-binding NarL/FixJ family response regulator